MTTPDMPPQDPQPTGPALPGWAPRPYPDPVPLQGRFVRLEKLDVTQHADALLDAYAADPEGRLWTYLFAEKPTDRAAFHNWVAKTSSTEDPLVYAIVDQASGRAVGVESFMRIDRANGVIEIGGINFSRQLQHTSGATEAIFLLMRRAFDELGYRRFEWKCDSLNAPSRRAALRLGFQFEGIFRQHVIYKGRSRDTAWYAIIDSDWPAIKAAFVAWLQPDNFDASGVQRHSLARLRAQHLPAG